VFDQLRSIIFCRFLTMARSPAFDALKVNIHVLAGWVAAG
jgi:hypothetical protein